MKQLSEYINEKLVLNKDTFKRHEYKYFPKTKGELFKTISQLIEEQKNQDIIDLNDIDTSMITDMCELFSSIGEVKKIKKIDISSWDVSNVSKMKDMFFWCENLESTGDLSLWDVSNVTSMINMFGNCYNLYDIGDLSSWNVSKVENMSGMFKNDENLEYIGDISSWKVTKLAAINNMFYGCEKLRDIGDLDKWSNNKIVYMGGAFSSAAFKLLKNIKIPSWYDA